MNAQAVIASAIATGIVYLNGSPAWHIPILVAAMLFVEKALERWRNRGGTGTSATS